jgi:hypothetical protein
MTITGKKEVVMSSQVVTCPACKVGLRVPEVTVRSIFKCPKCQERVRVDPTASASSGAESSASSTSSAEPAREGGALGALKGFISSGGTKIKDAFNISGVDLKLEGHPTALADASGTMRCKLVLTSGTEKTVRKLGCSLAGASGVAGAWSAPEAIKIGAGQTLTKAVEFPYSIQGARLSQYLLNAQLDVDGALRSVKASEKLGVVGDVAIELHVATPSISRTSSRADGTIVLTAHRDRIIQDLTCRFMMVETWDPALEKLNQHRNKLPINVARKRKESLVSEWVHRDTFRIRAGERKIIPFTIGYALRQTMRDMGGMLGAMGTMASYLQNETDEYYLLARCVVQQALVLPQVRRNIAITS